MISARYPLSTAVVLAALYASASAQVPIVSMFPVTTQTSFPSPQCTKGPSSTEKFTVNYNFESLERIDSVSSTTEIGVYNLLNFKFINGVETDPDLDGNHLGSAPHTYPNLATFSSNLPIIDDLLTPNVSMVTADYIESTVTSFTPKSFWYGCVSLSPVSAGSLPKSCNITATGFDGNGKLVATQTFGFAANGSIVQDQKHGVFQGFKNVRSVAFGVAPLLTAGLIDNLISTLYQEECSPYYTGSYNDGT